MTEDTAVDLRTLTVDIVAGYVSNNELRADELASVIGSTYQALNTAGTPAPDEPQTPQPDKAAVRKSVSPDHLTSFVDGRKYKSLKRHLTTQGLTPDAYRERYGLPSDYPMVAPNYSAQRSALAKTLGLGRKAAAAATSAPPPQAPKPGRRGRAKAAAEASS